MRCCLAMSRNICPAYTYGSLVVASSLRHAVVVPVPGSPPIVKERSKASTPRPKPRRVIKVASRHGLRGFLALDEVPAVAPVEVLERLLQHRAERDRDRGVEEDPVRQYAGAEED